MEIDKTLALQAPPHRVWALLLDPQAMGECVPGMESIEVLSPDEYVALMRVKMAFISARFKLRTRIVERREPLFLLAEGTGEDASVASSLKQRTEMHLAPRGDDGTDLRLKVQVDLMGRMGAFGLSAMKTKADRLWDEFGVNLAQRLSAGEAMAGAPVPAAAEEAEAAPAAAAPEAITPAARPASAAPMAGTVVTPAGALPRGWWARLLRAIGIQPAGAMPAAGTIVIEMRRPDQTQIRIEWPAANGLECAQWLRDALR